MQTVLLCSHCINAKNIGIVIPWLGTVENNGAAIGSSFIIAMKRLNYSTPFVIMPLRCEERFSVITQV